MDTVALATLDAEIARPSRAGRHDEGIVFGADFVNVVRDADCTWCV